jgi:hypothetical protein
MQDAFPYHPSMQKQGLINDNREEAEGKDLDFSDAHTISVGNSFILW